MKKEDRTNYWFNQGSIYFENRIIKQETINTRISNIRRFLTANGLDKRSVAAIFTERSENALILMFALLSMGIPFVNIDVSLPENRWRYMLDYLKADIVVTESKRIDHFKNSQVSLKKIFDIVEIVYYHGSSGGIRDANTYSCEHDTAYYLYTSGTTGKPKAVEITQKGLRNFIRGISEQIPLKENMRVLCSTSMSFDIFFLESILAMKLGLQVVLASEEERKNVKKLLDLIESKQVEVVQMTPAQLRMLQNYDKKFRFLKTVKYLLVGGEAFTEGLLQDLQKDTDCRIFNMYGPTETTIWSSIAELTDEDEVNIGKPILNTGFYILNEALEMIPNGEKGEIYISGDGLANGYKGDPGLTKRKFINPFADEQLRLYRTGDIGKEINGIFYCFGRIDNQIKYRGHRIELEEIDANISECEGVNEAVSYFNAEIGEGCLEAIFTGEAGIEEVRDFLKQRIPSYMVPKRLVKAERLHLTSSGKIDRERNRRAYLEETNLCIENENEAGETLLTDRILKIFTDCLPETAKGIEAGMSIEQLGMDSLDFIKIVVRIEDDFEIQFEEEMLLFEKFDTVKDFVLYAAYLLAQKGA